MNKPYRLIKRYIALLLALLFSIESFAAVVGDNDGAAFITKAEFDSMKNDFQSQLDRYNSSIDNKIDGAIAAYLSGVDVKKKVLIKLDSHTNYCFPLKLCFNNNKWNDPTNDWYDVSRVRVRRLRYPTAVFAYQGSLPDLEIVSSPSDVSTQSVKARNTRDYVYTIVKSDESVDIPPISGQLWNVTKSNDVRRLGSETFQVFDRVTYGRGYQYIDYVAEHLLGLNANQGHFVTNATSQYVYWYIIGMAYGLPITPTVATDVINDHHMNGGGFGVLNAGFYQDQLKNNRTPGNKIKYSIMRNNWNGFNMKMIILTDESVQDSAQFVWDKTNESNLCFAGNASCPASLLGKFAYDLSWTNGADTMCEHLCNWFNGHDPVVWINNKADGTATNVGRFLACSWAYMPPLTATTFDGRSSTTTVPSFSALNASCVRYYDEENIEHFLDEGMFLKTFTEQGEVEFSVVFGTTGTSKSLNFYVSKKPFNSVNQKTKLDYFFLDNATTSGTSSTLQTGTKYHIKVPDIEKGDQLFIAWEPVNSDDNITLNSFEDFYFVS